MMAVHDKRITMKTNIDGVVVRSVVNSKEVYFFAADSHDLIQRIHMAGAFYEAEELGIIARYMKPGDCFLDVGSNVGNHSLYVAHFLRPSKVIPIEANPHVASILEVNVRLNNLMETFDLRYLNFGLSDAQGTADIRVPSPDNIGAAYLEGTTNGSITIITGDTLLRDTQVNFIKIDTEGMELNVLRGLSGIIASQRPILFVEVDNRNLAGFLEWMSQNQYRAVERFRRYHANENFLAVPEPVTTEGEHWVLMSSSSTSSL
jgi:FkbM family methyltransferase